MKFHLSHDQCTVWDLLTSFQKTKQVKVTSAAMGFIVQEAMTQPFGDSYSMVTIKTAMLKEYSRVSDVLSLAELQCLRTFPPRLAFLILHQWTTLPKKGQLILMHDSPPPPREHLRLAINRVAGVRQLGFTTIVPTDELQPTDEYVFLDSL